MQLRVGLGEPKATWLRSMALTTAVVIGLSGAARGDDRAAQPSAGPGLFERLTRDRLSLGLRVSRWWLEDPRRYGENGLDNGNQGINFLGSLWGLDSRQRSYPTPFLEYRIVSVVGVGAAYDEARIETLDWADNVEKTMTAGDGDLRIRGVQAYLFGRPPNRTRVTPSLRIGYGRYWSAFFETQGWAFDGRYFEVEDTRGWYLGASVSVALRRHVDLDLSYERLRLSDVSAKARFPGGGRKAGVFPLQSDVLRAGIAYRF